MNYLETLIEAHKLFVKMNPYEALKRLQGVQCPEQSLVEESRSDEQPDGAEERSEGTERSLERSGVEKIVQRTELERLLDFGIKEAQGNAAILEEGNYLKSSDYFKGKAVALEQLRERLDMPADKRSDLLNAEGETRR